MIDIFSLFMFLFRFARKRFFVNREIPAIYFVTFDRIEEDEELDFLRI